MFQLQSHTSGTTTRAKALRPWCTLGGMGLGLELVVLTTQDSSYLSKPASIRFANPEAGT
jgi:hypothetical protein